MASPQLGMDQCSVVCPSCRQHVTTTIQRKPSVVTHMMAMFLCVIGFWPCACSLYCTKCARNVEHYCPSCNAYIGLHIFN